MTGKGRHVSYNADGELCMTVVDPVTRKLLIPTQYIFDTRAQQRNTLPSLCQLFLSGRCRQGQGCYQVHANWEVVQRLRSQVDSLPCCCPDHGDKDHLGVLENAPLRDFLSTRSHHHTGANNNNGAATTTTATDASTMTATAAYTVCARDVVVYIPGCSTYEGSYVPLERVSYTIGLRRLLEEQHVLAAAPCARVSLLNPETGFPEDKIVADASAATVCRLHAMDRCRYAEECKFLHLCKELTVADPQLTATPAATTPDCATTTVPEGSFEASMTSTGMSATIVTNASAMSMDRRGQDAHSASATCGQQRQSVFTSVSMQQLQLFSLGVGGAGDSFAGEPLLVPQREKAIMGGGAAAVAAAPPQGTPVPFVSKGMQGHHGATNIPATTTQNTQALPADNSMWPNAQMSASLGSFPGNNNYSLPHAMSGAYTPGTNGRIRVALSLPTVSSFSAVNNAAASGASNSSEKGSTPEEETLATAHMNYVGNCCLVRSVPQSYGTASSHTRWHHNPYSSSLLKCVVPSVGGCSRYSYGNGHTTSSCLFSAMAR
jgi:hypothetical protein